VLAFDEVAFVPDPDGWTRVEPKQDKEISSAATLDNQIPSLNIKSI
jgi:hypothetical protein